MIDKKSKILFSIFLVLIAGSVIFSYYRFIIKKDFAIFTPPPEASEEAEPESI